MIKTTTVQVIDLEDFDQLVKDTYGRHYSLQQQDGCKQRQRVPITVPEPYVEEYENIQVPEEVNHGTMGVSFAAWLARDPNQKLTNPDNHAEHCLDMWWGRNFYPELSVVVNDLHAKGLLDEGEYEIDIDW